MHTSWVNLKIQQTHKNECDMTSVLPVFFSLHFIVIISNFIVALTPPMNRHRGTQSPFHVNDEFFWGRIECIKNVLYIYTYFYDAAGYRTTAHMHHNQMYILYNIFFTFQSPSNSKTRLNLNTRRKIISRFWCSR